MSAADIDRAARTAEANSLLWDAHYVLAQLDSTTEIRELPAILDKCASWRKKYVQYLRKSGEATEATENRG